MFLVKSCFKKDNILKRKTIKIGSLFEYKKTEQQQIADTDEATYEINFNIADIDLPQDFLNDIQEIPHSYSGVKINDFFIRGPSTTKPKHVYYNRIDMSLNIANSNRFVFCISHLKKPSLSDKIFSEYDDKWFISNQKIKSFTKILKNELKKEIKNLTASGGNIFDYPVDLKSLHVNCIVQKITYMQRNLSITNKNYAELVETAPNLLKGIRFIKPVSYKHEHEIRFCFDIFSQGKLLHPTVDFIIIDASEIIKLID